VEARVVECDATDVALDQQHNELRERTDALGAREADLVVREESLRIEREQLVEDSRAVQRQREEYEALSVDRETFDAEMSEKLGALNDRVAAAEDRDAELTTREETLRAERETLDEETEALQRQQAEQREAFEAEREADETLRAQRKTDLDARTADMDARDADLLDREETLRTELERLDQETQSLQRQRDDLVSLAAEREGSESAIQLLNSELDDVRTKLANVTLERDELATAIDELRAAFESVRTDLLAQQELADQQQQADEQLAELRTTEESLLTQVAEMQSALEEARGSTTDQTQDLEHRIQEQQTTIDDLQQQLEAVTKAAEEAARTVAERQNEQTQSLHGELEQRADLLNQREQELSERHRVVENSEHELEDQRRQLLDARHQLEQARTELQTSLAEPEMPMPAEFSAVGSIDQADQLSQFDNEPTFTETSDSETQIETGSCPADDSSEFDESHPSRRYDDLVQLEQSGDFAQDAFANSDASDTNDSDGHSVADDSDDSSQFLATSDFNTDSEFDRVNDGSSIDDVAAAEDFASAARVDTYETADSFESTDGFESTDALDNPDDYASESHDSQTDFTLAEGIESHEAEASDEPTDELADDDGDTNPEGGTKKTGTTALRSELAHLFGISSDSIPVSSVKDGSVSGNTVSDHEAVEMRFSENQHLLLDSEDVEETAEEETDEDQDFVANYMEQLLARNRGSAGGQLPRELSGSARDRGSQTKKRNASMLDAYMSGNLKLDGDDQPAANASASGIPTVPRPTRPKQKIDPHALRANMNSFREVSAQSVEKALASHAKKQQQNALLLRQVLLISLCVGAVLLIGARIAGVIDSILVPLLMVGAVLASAFELFKTKSRLNEEAASGSNVDDESDGSPSASEDTDKAATK